MVVRGCPATTRHTLAGGAGAPPLQNITLCIVQQHKDWHMKGVTVGLTTAYACYQLFTVETGLFYNKKSSPVFAPERGGGKLLSYIVFTENGKD